MHKEFRSNWDVGCRIEKTQTKHWESRTLAWQTIRGHWGKSNECDLPHWAALKKSRISWNRKNMVRVQALRFLRGLQRALSKDCHTRPKIRRSHYGTQQGPQVNERDDKVIWWEFSTEIKQKRYLEDWEWSSRLCNQKEPGGAWRKLRRRNSKDGRRNWNAAQVDRELAS